jgi:Domain of unknown function (DUF1929)
VRDRGKARRLWVLGLSVCAAALAASIFVTPRVIGDQIGPPTDLSFLNVVEGGTVDHAGDHLAATPEATVRAAARDRYCDQDAWRADHEAFCPEDAPTAREARTIQAAGLTQSPLATTEADGSWGPLLHIPTNAIHAVLMRTGKVLWFSQPKYPTEQDAVDGGTAHVWDPATNTSRSVPPPSVSYPVSGPGGASATRPANIWCAGQTLLSDGRVLVVGGNLEYPEDTGTGSGNGAGNGFKGAPWVMTFDPVTETWTRYQDMPHGRWYPTLTELPDGRVLILGGWDESGGRDSGGAAQPALMDNDQDVEVFDPSTPAGGRATTVVSKLPPGGPGQPTPYPDHRGLGLYPHAFVLPSTTTLGAGGAKVLVAGPTRYDSAVIDTSTWVWTDVVSVHPDAGQPRLSQDRAWGTGWLAPSGTDGSTSVVLLGGADTAGVAPGPNDAAAAVGTSETLDLDLAIADPGSGWKLGVSPDLNIGRGHFNTTLLPDGSIFSNGGGIGRKDNTLYADPVYRAELLEPGLGWREVGNEADARTYHSTALLLPDASVVSAGDDRDIAPPAAAGAVGPGHIPLGNRTAQIYSPPYLFAGTPPSIRSLPANVDYDQPFVVGVDGNPADITRVALVRPGAVTHANNMSQQVIALPLTVQAGGLGLRSPLDATVAPPGYYMVFAQNAAGAMSAGRWVHIGPPLPVPSTPTPTPVPAPGPAVVAPKDQTAPKATITATRASVLGRAVTVRLQLRSSEPGSLRVSVAGVGRGAKVTLTKRWRAATGLTAGRTRSLVIAAHLAGRVAPKRLRVTLRVTDPAGNVRRVVRVVPLVRNQAATRS